MGVCIVTDIEELRAAKIAQVTAQMDRTESVCRVIGCFSAAEREFGLVGIDDLEPHVDLELYVDRDDIIEATAAGTVRQHMGADGHRQNLWSLTDKGIEMMRRTIEFGKRMSA